MDIDKIRKDQFPVTQNLVYLNHAGVSPLPARSAQKGRAHLQELLSVGAYDPHGMLAMLEMGKERFARLVGASSDKIAFVKATSEGLSYAAGGLAWKEGDNLLTNSRQFPSNLYPWMALEKRGVDVRMVEPEAGRVNPDKLFEAADSRTRLLTISSVEFVTGFRHDLERIGRFCRERDILFVVDAIQSLGLVPLNVMECNIDVLAAGGHKWLLGSEGIGGLYVSAHAMDRLEPIEFGWYCVRNCFDFETLDFTLDATARRYEPSIPSILLAGILSESIALLLEHGVDRVYERVAGLVDYLAGKMDPSWQVLTPMGEAERSGIFTFVVPGIDGAALHRKLHEKKIVVSPRGGGIRVSPHFYNNVADIDVLMEGVKESIGELRSS
ncbi:MAG: aminotransferase class V-fold PLP-dependent enzyme [Pseudomonadota bacterium]